MIGLLAIILLWLSAAISVPLINRYSEFRPEMLLVMRGFAVILAFLAARKNSFFRDKQVIFGGLLLAVSSINFFQAINLWSANSVIIIVTMTPVVNVLIALGHGTRISTVTILSLILVIVGVSFALDVFHQVIHMPGLILSLLCMIAAGLGMDCWSKTKVGVAGKMLAYSTILILLSIFVISVTPGKAQIVPTGVSVWTAFYVYSAVGCLGGIVYLCCVGIALERLPVTTTSILLQGETPAVIIGSWFIVGEKISLWQWIGVVIMLTGIILLMLWTAKNPPKTTPTPPE